MTMSDSIDVKDILGEILTNGLLRIRSLAWAGDSARCAVEADHIHNLPHVLALGDPEGLVYYWEVERTSFMDRSDSDQIISFEPLWQRLQAHMDTMATSGTAR